MPAPKKLKKHALDLLRMGEKVYNYRRDILSPEDADSLKENTENLYSLYKNKETSEADLEASIVKQNDILEKTGGKFYPNRFWSENVETVLVVAIVIVAFRIFFFQPFVIPTNSMYPTYSGMQPEVYDAGAQPISPVDRLLGKLLRGSSHFRIEAENSGEITIPLNTKYGTPGYFAYDIIPGRNFFIIPTTKKRYTIFVGREPHTIDIPSQYYLDEVIRDRFGAVLPQNRFFSGRQAFFRTGETVDSGEAVLQFDFLMGDALFVNRFWYHFFPPKSGDPFVFRTETFQDRSGYPDTVGEDKFYIKRLTGEPGQTLQIVDGALLQDDKPAQGAKAFQKNAEKEGEYNGYENAYLLAEGETFKVPEDHYFGMGDNSFDSKDCRAFGPVPQKEIIGSASFIYYPFTKRWGLAK